MFHSIASQVERIGSYVGAHPFSCGVLTGLAVALAIVLFFILLELVSRPRKLRSIVIPANGGELRIDAKAVQGAVLAVAASFPDIEVRKVILHGTQASVGLLVAMDFSGAVPLADLSERFRAAIARMMTDVLGMAKPARIEMEILSSGAEFHDVEPGRDESATSGASASESSGSEPGQSC